MTDPYRSDELPTDVFPEPPKVRTPEQLRAHLDRGRRICSWIRTDGYGLDEGTLDKIERLLIDDRARRDLAKERAMSLKEADRR